MPASLVGSRVFGLDKPVQQKELYFPPRRRLLTRPQELVHHKKCRVSPLSTAAPVQGASTSAPERRESSVQEQPSSQAEFKWEKQWYPLAVVKDLDMKLPNPVQLLGKKLVLWRDQQGNWRCFEDACPHRLAPLSEGRIEKDGLLMCSYHGWRFDGEGRCTSIPQATNLAAEATAAASPRACAAVHPTQARPDGLLWVWAESGPHAVLESALTQPVVAEETENAEGTLFVTTWFVRDLPYGVDILCENVLDPSHVPYSHHGVIGNRYKPVIYKMDAPSEIDVKAGFQVHNQRYVATPDAAAAQNGASSLNADRLKQEPSGTPGAPPPKNLMLWQPPALARYKFGGPTQTQMVTYNVPTAPGRSRIFFSVLMAKDKAPAMLRRLLPLVPRWLRFLGHFEQNSVLDGDNVFLHGQDLELRRRKGDWRNNYYLPTSGDAAVAGVRRWFARTPALPWASDSAPPAHLTRAQMLDRFETHTKICPTCMRALKFFSALRIAVAGIAAGLMLHAAAVAGAGARLMQLRLAAPIGLALSCGLAWLYLSKLRAKFIFVDYVHAEHN